MKELLDTLSDLKNSDIELTIRERIGEFRKIKDNSLTEIFNELCFCIMTANCSAEKCIEVQNRIGNGFCQLNEQDLSLQLKKFGYRFPNIRAKYIAIAKESQQEMIKRIRSDTDLFELREWLVKNIKGLGYKEASHFLRNIGFTDFAIIDFHIIDLLTKFNLIEKPKTVSKTKYLEIEKLLGQIAEKLNLNLAELDLYMWFMETGKVLK
jgi:N-glycosylase/DNA lyase